MKMNYGLILTVMLSTSVMAQVATNTPPALTPPDAALSSTNTPAPVPDTTTTTNKPANKVKHARKKPAPKHTASESPPAPPPLPNELAVAIKNNVVVRGQPHINSEVVGHLKRGDTVNVLEIVTLKHPKTDEPTKWAKIAIPADMHVWVNTSFIDATNQVVSARKLNVRTGPGENYSVVGMLVQGDAIKAEGIMGSWTKIAPPTNVFAFVAAHLLSHKETTPESVTTPPVVTPPVTPVSTMVENPTGITAAPTGVPGGTPVATNTPAPVFTPPILAPLPTPVMEEPAPPRIVEREGIVGGTVSIQAPAHFQLYSLDNGEVMDYLYTTSTNLVLKRYKGRTVVVTGEEELDERWPNTPVLTIQKIQVVK